MNTKLDFQPISRRGDPSTSREAAEKTEKVLPKRQAQCLRIIAANPGICGSEIEAKYPQLRKRIRELERKGEIICVGERKSAVSKFAGKCWAVPGAKISKTDGIRLQVPYEAAPQPDRLAIAKIAQLEAELRSARTQVARLTKERDDWKAEANRLMKMRMRQGFGVEYLNQNPRTGADDATNGVKKAKGFGSGQAGDEIDRL